MTLAAAPAHSTFDVHAVRRDFPILQQQVHGHPLAYLDNAATTQKPQCVIDAITDYYTRYNANIHRATHTLAEQATRAYEDARRAVARFIHAPEARSCIFTRGTTDGINLVAHAYLAQRLKPGDEVLLTALEHHSNIVPWQMVCDAAGARLRIVPILDDGDVDYPAFEALLSEKTKFVAATWLSNALGTVVDAPRIVAAAHKVGAKVLIDAAQWVGHFPTDVQALDADYVVFSGHKLFGPTGIGVLWGRAGLLEEAGPYQGGGDMIETVTFEKTTYAGLPNKFEAGTQDMAGAVGLAAAIEYLTNLGLANVHDHEAALLAYCRQRLAEVPGVRLLGGAKESAAVCSFVFEGADLQAHDLGVLLDGYGVAVRTGHHCCMPLMHRLGVAATVRASFAFYNTTEEIDQLVEALEGIRGKFSGRHEGTGGRHGGTEARRHEGEDAEADYPEASASSIDEAAREMVETFDFLPDWNERMQFLLELGDKVKTIPEGQKNEATRVHGCQSTVHLTARLKPGTADVVQFVADSDAAIVKGLIGLLQHVYAGQRAADILAFDIEAFLKQLGLDQHLTVGRRNGLEGMIKRIQLLARSLSGRHEGTEARRHEG